MGSDSPGRIQIGPVAALAGLILLLMLLLGGFTVASPDEVPGQTQTESEGPPYTVSVSETRVAVQNDDGDPFVYDQLVLYVKTDPVTQQLELEETDAMGDDGDRLFEAGESAIRPLNHTLEAGNTASVSIVNTAGSEIVYTTTTNVTTALDG